MHGTAWAGRGLGQRNCIDSFVSFMITDWTVPARRGAPVLSVSVKDDGVDFLLTGTSHVSHRLCLSPDPPLHHSKP
ncbi:hypothetical protein J6590_001350 [Homalodisca vitripennis]|nr:hypothetical protein J6590_001350 [Homalodisca vitripennis]